MENTFTDLSHINVKGGDGGVDIPYQGIMYVTRNIDKPLVK